MNQEICLPDADFPGSTESLSETLKEAAPTVINLMTDPNIDIRKSALDKVGKLGQHGGLTKISPSEGC